MKEPRFGDFRRVSVPRDIELTHQDFLAFPPRSPQFYADDEVVEMFDGKNWVAIKGKDA
jgi:hypothetical protein